MLTCRQLCRRSQQTPSLLAKIISDTAESTKSWLFLPIAAYWASLPLVLSSRGAGFLRTAAVIALIGQVALWFNVLLNGAVEQWTLRRLKTSPAGVPLLTLTGFIARVAVWSIALLLILQNMGIEVTALLTGLGIGGVAIALAVQNILGDLFASLSIAVDKPFVIGDFIEVGQMMGTVESVGLKTTRLRSLWGELLVFPNHDVLQSRIRNYERMNERRVQFQFTVPIDTEVELLRSIPSLVRETVERQAAVRFDRAHLQNLTELGAVFEVAYYVLSSDYNRFMDVQQEIYFEILDQLGEKHVEIARPSRTIHIDPLPPLDGLARSQRTAANGRAK